MSYATVAKTAILVAALVAANALLGVVCGWVYLQYEVLFIPGPKLVDLAIWVFGTIGLVAITAGLVVALVRPFWAIMVAFLLSALAIILAWGASIVSVGLGALYFALAMAYARSVVGELNNRLDFSVRPIGGGQGTLLFALVLLVSISFALGYREDALRRGFVVPPSYSRAVEEMVLPLPEALIEGQGELGPAQKEAASQMLAQGVKMFLGELETLLQPYRQFIPVALALILFWTLETILGFVSWVPPLLLSGIFPLLKVLGMTRVITETKEVRRLTLDYATT